MKRIKSACLLQTLHFQLKEDLGHAAAAHAVREDVKNYKLQLERAHTRYQIVDEVVQPDDSIVVRVKKQYNNHPCDAYMD